MNEKLKYGIKLFVVGYLENNDFYGHRNQNVLIKLYKCVYNCF